MASKASLPCDYSSKNKGKNRVCAGCETKISHGPVQSFMDVVWHSECFCCVICDLPIVQGDFYLFRSFPYHKSCNDGYLPPKCDICKKSVTLPHTWKVHAFNQKICPSHISDGTPRCIGCRRFKPRDAVYNTLDDGRMFCSECKEYIILENNEAQLLYYDIQEFFEGLNMKFTQGFPLLVVEREDFRETKKKENDVEPQHTETMGRCISEFLWESNSIDTTPKLYRTNLQLDVVAILVLNGLPRLKMGSLIAHEMMHAWLESNGYYPLDLKVEEGLCEVMSHLWLESEIKSASPMNVLPNSPSSSTSMPSHSGIKSQFEKRLCHFLIGAIETNIIPLYGDGFRAAHQAVLQYGLEQTLEHVRLTGDLPC